MQTAKGAFFADTEIVTEVTQGPPVYASVPEKGDGEERDSSHRQPTTDSNGAKQGGEFSAEGQPPPEEGTDASKVQPSSLQNTHLCAVSTSFILSFEHSGNKPGMAPVFLPL